MNLANEVNSRIYYDHCGETKNRPITGSRFEIVSEIVMSTTALCSGSKDAAKLHAKRAIESAMRTAVKK
jgi:hypothetical protein